MFPRTITLLPNTGKGKRNPGHCRSCHKSVFWCRTEAGKSMPFDCHPEPIEVLADGREIVKASDSHFSTCPQARAWSRK